jgi:hypothetical protein
MKCENCGMGFIITPINVDKVCPHCGHIHGDSEVSNKEDNMVKKIVKWIWNIVCWPIKKAKQWLWG